MTTVRELYLKLQNIARRILMLEEDYKGLKKGKLYKARKKSLIEQKLLYENKLADLGLGVIIKVKLKSPKGINYEVFFTDISLEDACSLAIQRVPNSIILDSTLVKTGILTKI